MDMVSEWELWAAANEVIRQHGDNSLTWAATRQSELVENGDVTGSIAWQQIILKIIELRREKPAPGEAVQ